MNTKKQLERGKKWNSLPTMTPVLLSSVGWRMFEKQMEINVFVKVRCCDCDFDWIQLQTHLENWFPSSASLNHSFAWFLSCHRFDLFALCTCVLFILHRWMIQSKVVRDCRRNSEYSQWSENNGIMVGSIEIGEKEVLTHKYKRFDIHQINSSKSSDKTVADDEIAESSGICRSFEMCVCDTRSH